WYWLACDKATIWTWCGTLRSAAMGVKPQVVTVLCHALSLPTRCSNSPCSGWSRLEGLAQPGKASPAGGRHWAHLLCFPGFPKPYPRSIESMSSPLKSLIACGTKLWLDSIDPEL